MPQMLTNSIRIIGGKWRGKKLTFTANSPARPTLDQIRETVFNWLQPVIRESQCLDMFAGSGALGIEALSRGAAHVTFVDQDTRTLTHLSIQLKELGAVNSKTLRLSMPTGLSQICPPALDIIFLDPPFETDLLDKTLQSLTTSTLVKPGTLVYFETNSHHTFDFDKVWELHRHKKTKRISFGLLKFI